jgi:hypothetical protein
MVRVGEHHRGVPSGDAALVALAQGARAGNAEAVRPDIRGALIAPAR